MIDQNLQATLLQAIASASSDLVFAKDLQGRYTFANPATLSFIGRTAAEVLGRTDGEVLGDAGAAGRVMAHDRRIMDADAAEMLEEEVPDPEGSPRVWLATKSPYRDEQGQVIGILGIARDITDRKRAEEALRASENRYRTLFTHMTEGFALGEAICDASGAGVDFRFLAMNEAFERQSGLRPGEAVGRPMTEVLPHLERTWVDTYCGVALGGAPVRFESYNADLNRHFEVFCYSPARGRFAILFSDVSHRRRAEAALREREEALRESEERFRTLADHIPQLAWIADASGWITWYNQRWFDFTGATLAESEGWGWQRFHHPDHVERVNETARRGFQAGSPFEDTFPLRGRDGAYRWFLTRVVPIRDEAGRLVRWFGTNTDVTGQREVQESLREADRRKDQFLAMLSHELRNPLAPIRSATYVLARSEPGGDLFRRSVEVIDRQAAHLSRLVEDLLDVTRIARGKIELHREGIDLARVVALAADDHRAFMLERGLHFEASVPAEPVWLLGDATRLTQAIGNLLQNAAKFTHEGGRITINLSRDETAAVLRVEDTGMGIAPEVVAHVFEAFMQADRSLHRSRGGLGLGLALVRALAELHGGTAVAESEGVGRGARFTLRLPLAPPGVAPEDPVAEPIDGAGGAARAARSRRRILVVDDNHDAAEALSELAELMGHEVEVVHDGPSALVRARATRPDLVLCDIGLPGMSGYEVARAMRDNRVLAETELVALSGYAQADDLRRSREAGFHRHLAKPAEPATLLALFEGAGRIREEPAAAAAPAPATSAPPRPSRSPA